MHGLNTLQGVTFLPPILRFSLSNADLGAQTLAMTCDDPLYLNATLFGSPSPPTATTEYYVKRGYRVYSFTNTRTYPCIMERTILRARTSIPKNAAFADIYGAVLTIMDDGQPAPLSYMESYLSPLTSPTLHKWFKILSRKKTVMLPGKMYNHTQRMQRAYLKRSITPMAEGNTGDYVLCKGSTVYFYRFYGVPTYNKASTNDTTLTDVRVVRMAREYISWYRMDDADTTNVRTSTLPADRNVALGYPYPTQYSHSAIIGGSETDGRMNNVEYVGLLSTGANNLLGTTSSAPLHTVTP